MSSLRDEEIQTFATTGGKLDVEADADDVDADDADADDADSDITDADADDTDSP
jgi:hypothetical protein